MSRSSPGFPRLRDTRDIVDEFDAYVKTRLNSIDSSLDEFTADPEQLADIIAEAVREHFPGKYEAAVNDAWKDARDVDVLANAGGFTLELEQAYYYGVFSVAEPSG